MIVVGGCYNELCVSPKEEVTFGSGGRAAMAIALGGGGVKWHYYCPESDQSNIEVTLSHENLTHFPVDSDELVTFRYFHPLSKPEFTPPRPKQNKRIVVEGESVLRFGFMEGEAEVHGGKVVYDPQSPNEPAPFSQNGSTAESLAIVLNSSEVLTLGKSRNEQTAVRRIRKSEHAEIILVKAGTQGCRVYRDGTFVRTVPPYRTESVYKVGSGDVFSAAFAFHWIKSGMAAEDAADAASRCTARYCNRRWPSVELDQETDKFVAVASSRKKAKVYIAGPFFTMGELWLIEEAMSAFADLGVEVFSPYHEVGPIGRRSAASVVQADLKGMEDCTAIFAVIDGCDPGTIFEVGYAVKKCIPVVAFSQNPKKGDQTMIEGSSRCTISSDFASAIYLAAWESRSR